MTLEVNRIAPVIFMIWVGGLAWYDSWFGSKGSGVRIAPGPPLLLLVFSSR